MAQAEIACFWEKQGADKLCAVHCINTLLQGPYFTEVALAKIAQDLDAAEMKIMQEAGTNTPEYQEFLARGSLNVDADGNFSVGVIEEALKGWGGLRLLNMEHPEVSASVKSKPESEVGYICNSHARAHWFTIRKVRSRWFDLDSLKHSPTRIGDVYLNEFLNATRQQGFTIFVVRGPPLPDPNPGQFQGSTGSHQHFCTDRKIDELKKQGEDKEQREMEEAQRIGGGAASGSAEGDDSGTKSFLVGNPNQKKPETDWKSLGAGQTLGGSSNANIGADDAELQAALRASMQEAGSGEQNVPEEPENTGAGICTLQVRLPGNKRCQRRFIIAEHTVEHLFTWLEHTSVHDDSLGLPVLSNCSYCLVRRGVPGAAAKLERSGGAAKAGGEDVGAKMLADCGFATGMEAAILQL